jgi:hypothetical protein
VATIFTVKSDLINLEIANSFVRQSSMDGVMHQNIVQVEGMKKLLLYGAKLYGNNTLLAS